MRTILVIDDDAGARELIVHQLKPTGCRLIEAENGIEGIRKSLNYPPFARLIQLKISGRDKNETARHADAVGKECAMLLRNNNDYTNKIEVLGPIESPIQKIAGKYRWQILLKGKRVAGLHAFLHRLLSDHPFILTSKNVNVVIDVDPVFMM